MFSSLHCRTLMRLASLLSVLLIACLYHATASVILTIAMPFAIAGAFLSLWVWTTATSNLSHLRLFATTYVFALGTLVAVASYAYSHTAWPAIVLVIAMPGALGVPFLALWVGTTAKGTRSYGRTFLVVYLLTIAVLVPATWTPYPHDAPLAKTLNVLRQEKSR